LPDLSQDDFYHAFKSQFCQKSYDLDHSSLYISDSLLHKKIITYCFEIVPLFIYSLIIYLCEVELCSEHVKQYKSDQSESCSLFFPATAFTLQTT